MSGDLPTSSIPEAGPNGGTNLRELERQQREMRADHTELESTVREIDSRLGTIETQGATMMENDKILFSKLDVIQNAVTTVRAGSGRISNALILTMIATFAPIVGGAAILGHVFLQQNVEALRAADTRQAESTTEAFALVANQLTEAARQTEKINDHLDDIRTSRWSKDDHGLYHTETVIPLRTQARENALQAARQDERLKFLEKGYERAEDPMHNVADAIRESNDILRELRDAEESEQRALANPAITDLLQGFLRSQEQPPPQPPNR